MIDLIKKYKYENIHGIMQSVYKQIDKLIEQKIESGKLDTKFDYSSLLPGEKTFHISAETGAGVDALLKALGEVVSGGVSNADAVTNLRPRDVIMRASEVLSATESDRKNGMTDDVIWSGIISACEILGEITGDEVKEDMIQRIFENFCVGK